MNGTLLVMAGALLAPAALLAQQPSPADSARRITFGGFVDAYVAHDMGRPRDLDRQYTTQPARHDEFNVNLAYVEAVVNAPRVRGRLALQAGTAVQSNYAAEPRIGTVSGPDVSRFLQEAYVGFSPTPTLWVDGGIFFSNMGMESWVSSQNPTYTRSFVGDYSAYYSTGVRAVWQATPTLSARLDLVNGWQNISETNTDKSVGARLDWTATPAATISYYGYAGNESEGRMRLFNGVGATIALAERVRLLVQADVGGQERAAGADGWAEWHGFTVVGRYQLTPAVALAARVERFDDGDETIVATDETLPGFRVSSASLGVDVVPAAGFTWRTELRGYDGDAAYFAARDAAGGRSGRNTLIVTSLAFGF